MRTRAKAYKSENGTNTSECWNNFDGPDVQEFINTYKPEFVDVYEANNPRRQKHYVWCWMENSEDTMVFVVPARPTWEFVDALNKLNANEMEIQKINGRHICRLWWD